MLLTTIIIILLSYLCLKNVLSIIIFYALLYNGDKKSKLYDLHNKSEIGRYMLLSIPITMGARRGGRWGFCPPGLRMYYIILKILTFIIV